MPKYSLGRKYSPDDRDKGFPMRAVAPRLTEIPERYWQDDIWWGDQGDSPHCVGYSWTHWLEDGPIVHEVNAHPVVSPVKVYGDAQKVDEWAGEDYEGTSVRAGAKVLQAMGFVSDYYWGWDAETVADTILNIGPVVVGTWWMEDMFYPDINGIIGASGRYSGGHAYLINGYSRTTDMFRVKNSWGKSWGIDGHAFISYADLDKLIKDDGEACLAAEQTLTVVTPPEPEPDPQPEPNPEPDLGQKSWWQKLLKWFRSLFV